MIDRARDYMKANPWIGWALFFALLVVGVALYFLRGRSAGVYSPESMREMLTIRYTDTDEVEKIPRGRLDKMLRGTGDTLDPAKGIINPKTGKPTGFLVDEDEWSAMIQRINAEKAAARATNASAKSAPRPQQPLPVDPAKPAEPGGSPPK
jgi:hypothetical protein